MKKRITAILLTVVTVLSLTACGGGPFTCDICGEEKTGKKYTAEFLGETITYCSDCAKELKELGGLEGMGGSNYTE